MDIDIETERYLREYADAKSFNWGWISTTHLSADFIREFRERLHPKHINDFRQKWNRINEIVVTHGEDFYMSTFNNYGYIDEGRR